MRLELTTEQKLERRTQQHAANLWGLFRDHANSLDSERHTEALALLLADFLKSETESQRARLKEWQAAAKVSSANHRERMQELSDKLHRTK